MRRLFRCIVCGVPASFEHLFVKIDKVLEEMQGCLEAIDNSKVKSHATQWEQSLRHIWKMLKNCRWAQVGMESFKHVTPRIRDTISCATVKVVPKAANRAKSISQDCCCTYWCHPTTTSAKRACLDGIFQSTSNSSSSAQ